MLRAIELRATAFYGINSVFFTGPSLKPIWPWFVMALLRGGHFPRTCLLCPGRGENCLAINKLTLVL
jgi:hypothetical protein